MRSNYMEGGDAIPSKQETLSSANGTQGQITWPDFSIQRNGRNKTFTTLNDPSSLPCNFNCKDLFGSAFIFPGNMQIMKGSDMCCGV